MNDLPARVLTLLLLLPIGRIDAADWPRWRGPNADGNRLYVTSCKGEFQCLDTRT